MRSQLTPKNVLFAILALIVAGVVAVGWGLSSMQTSTGAVVVGTHILNQ